MEKRMESAERTCASTLTAHSESASAADGRIRSGDEEPAAAAAAARRRA
jgi:hypothetical protein